MKRMQQSSCFGRLVFCVAIFALAASAQRLPEGAGRDELRKACTQCHELSRSISLRQDRDGWNQTMTKMAAFGMKVSQKDYAEILDYLTKNYPADEIPPVNVNTASAIELESGLNLRISQAKAVLAYRAKHGDFKSIEDLKKVPLIDAAQIEEKKDKIVF